MAGLSCVLVCSCLVHVCAFVVRCDHVGIRLHICLHTYVYILAYIYVCAFVVRCDHVGIYLYVCARAFEGPPPQRPASLWSEPEPTQGACLQSCTGPLHCPWRQAGTRATGQKLPFSASSLLILAAGSGHGRGGGCELRGGFPTRHGDGPLHQEPDMQRW